MAQILLIGFSAGAVSALLFSAIASGQSFAIGFFYLTPLPLLFVGLVWTHVATAIAALFAAIVLGSLFGAWFFLAYLIAIGIPAYVLSYLALLARPVGNGGGEQLEWYPPGRLVLAAAILAALSATATIPAFGLDLESYRSELKQTFERLLRAMTDAPADQPLTLPGVEDPDAFLDLLVVAIPAAAAALTMVTSLFNLWFAGTAARASGRLKRPWPDIPAMRFPNSTPFFLAGAIGGAFILPGLLGLIATLFTATLLIAYAALGLAVVHGASRALPARVVLLAVVWLFVLMLGWPLLVVAMIGLADSILDFRSRVSGGGPPNLPTQRPPE